MGIPNQLPPSGLPAWGHSNPTFLRMRRYPPAAPQIATAKTSVNANDIEGPIDKSLGTKEALAVRQGKFVNDSERKLLQGTLRARQSFQV